MDQDDGTAHRADAALTPARDIKKFERRFEAGQTVFDQGDRGVAMYVVLEGSVRIEDRSGAAPTIVAHRGPGEFFGEMALLDGERRLAAAVAEIPTRLAEIDRARFMYLVSQQPAFSLAIFRELIRRIPMTART